MAAMPAEEGAEKGEGQDGTIPMKGTAEGKPIGASIEIKVEGKETKPPVGKAGGGKKKKGKR